MPAIMGLANCDVSGRESRFLPSPLWSDGSDVVLRGFLLLQEQLQL